MTWLLKTISLAFLLVKPSASTGSSGWTVLETTIVPQDWTYVGSADPEAVVSLSISLSQPRLGELRKRLSQISDLGHEDFGSHLSRSELLEYRKPGDDASSSVLQWLTRAGVSHTPSREHDGGSWIEFSASVGGINSMLRCNLSVYETPQARRVLRATEYSLPSALKEHVQFVYPLIHFFEPSMDEPTVESSEVYSELSRRQSLPAACFDNTTPDCIVQLYNITYIPSDSSSGSTLGVAGFLEEYPNQASLHEFLLAHSPQRNDNGFDANYNFTVTSIADGAPNTNGSGGEALLDTFYTTALVQPLPVTYLSTGGRGFYIDPQGVDQSNTALNYNEPWLEFLTYFLAVEDDAQLPKVLSISYTDNEQATPRAYATHVCDLFMQLASRGVSVLAASGDGGAAGTSYDSNCIVNDGNSTTHPRFLPTFPASCPYVTSVGAVGQYLPPGPASFSSGGFSNYFPAPEWQVNDTLGYVNGTLLNDSHAGWYNSSGRGIPDVTAIGTKFLLGGEGRYAFTIKGTSASTPVWASIITLINDKRLRAGKPVLGFLNPLLYSQKVRAALEDVTTGSVGGCTYGKDYQVENGWDAGAGWDPASGLGVPNFGALLEVLG